jgi:hypothetical protein
VFQMTSKTIVRASLVTAGALAATVLAGTAAQAATGGHEHRNPGMQRMHQLMQEGNPGMQRMHQLMQEGNPGMQRMHQLMQQGSGGMQGMHMGPGMR